MDLNVSRAEEKQQLASLNDRLAQYIAYVQELKDDKSRLTAELQQLKVTRVSSIEDAKATYESEIESLRRALDNLAKEKAEVQLNAKRLRDRVKELEAENDELAPENERLQNELNDALALRDSTEAAYRREQKEGKSNRSKIKKLENEVAELTEKLASANADLERDALNQVALQNENQSLREELDFKEKLYLKSRTTIESISLTRSEEEIEEEYRLKYAGRLHDALAEMREQYEDLMKQFKDAMSKTRARSSGLNSSLLTVSESSGTDPAIVTGLRYEIDELRSSNARYLSDRDEARGKVASLNKRITSLEGSLSSLKRKHSEERKEYVAEIQKLQDDLDNLQAEYEDLAMAKIRLDQEIDQYRVLLHGEEVRLGLESQPSPTRPKTKKSKSSSKRKKGGDDYEESMEISTKRMRMNDSFAAAEGLRAETTTEGDVHIDELNLDGYYVKLSNMTDSNVKMGGFSLVTRGPDGEAAEYSFPKRFVLKAEESVMIWAESGSSFVDSDAGDLLWKKQDAFYCSADSETSLYDASGSVVSFTKLISDDGRQEIFDSGAEQGERRASCALM